MWIRHLIRRRGKNISEIDTSTRQKIYIVNCCIIVAQFSIVCINSDYFWFQFRLRIILVLYLLVGDCYHCDVGVFVFALTWGDSFLSGVYIIVCVIVMARYVAALFTIILSHMLSYYWLPLVIGRITFSISVSNCYVREIEWCILERSAGIRLWL